MAEETQKDRNFSIPSQKSPPKTVTGENLAWVVVSACDFEKVNQLAESLQIQRRPDRANLIREDRERLTLEANKDLDLRTEIIIKRVFKKQRSEI